MDGDSDKSMTIAITMPRPGAIRRHLPEDGVPLRVGWTWISEECVKNPCIDICKFDKKSGWCIGCGRTRDERKEWKKAPKKRLKEIKHDLPRRLEKLEERGKRAGD